jgi:DNA-binding NtrC family response regulator
VAKVGVPERHTVLVVDGDELVRWAVAQGLTEQGYAVEVAASAREALRCPKVAAALLDHDPPHVDGLVAAASLRSRHPRCVGILMTAEPTPELERRARERGITRVLGKPFSLEALVDALRDGLEGTPAPPGPVRGSPAGTAGGSGDGSGRAEAPHG